MMDILVACETSGEVRDAFRALGHNAISCDIQPSKRPGPHHKGRLENFISKRKWDMIIAFPPCTYVCSSGLHWNKRISGRAEKTDEALDFIAMIMNEIKKCGKGALENPIGCISTRIFFDEYEDQYLVLNEPNSKFAIKPAQIIHPYEFGHNASKSTCLYLWGLPKLVSTKYIKPRYIKGKPRWANQTDSGQNRMPPSNDRGDKRSVTFRGIARAMAKQWECAEFF